MLCFWIFFGFLESGTAVAQKEPVDPELQKLRNAIAESRGRVVDHEREERDIIELLDQLDRGLAELDAQVSESRKDFDRAEIRLEMTEESLKRAERKLAETQSAMSLRAVALYKAGTEAPLRLLFASEDLREMFSKLWNLERILRSDSVLLARFQSEQVELQEKNAQASRARSGLESAGTKLAARQRALTEEKNERGRLLAVVRENRTQERALLKGLEQAALALEETLASLQRQPQVLEAERAKSSSFLARRGKMASPVEGRVRRRFGRVVDAQYQTQIFRKGVEFSAGVGEDVRAVAPGRVRFAGWFRGYGKIVIVDHGDRYFTVSGQMAQIRVKVGETIQTGQVLGTVGETGSLEGPGLYFEVRRGGVPLDPAEWLTKG